MTFDEDDWMETPLPEIWVSVNPMMVIQLFVDALIPKVPPVMVTEAPGAVVITIGAVEVPEWPTVTVSL
jgi:hypothetical protein